jgi:purine-binding chemotaxis protein CheW
MVAVLSDTDQFYGILTIGESQVALPLAGLREVIPCPQQLIVLPTQAPGLLGAVDLRGQVIPVLDLRVVLRVDATRTPQQVVVVVVHDGQLLGLLADEVRGVTTIPVSALHVMTAVGEVGLLFSHSFERSEDASVVSVLDVAAICRLPGTPLVQDSPIRDVDGAGAGGPNRGSGSTHPADPADPAAAGRRSGVVAGDETHSLLLMRCGEVGLGIEIEHVHATLPPLDVRASPLRHGICLGVVEYGGAQVPVIDPLRLMGMGMLPPDRAQGLVLRFDAGLIILLITEVIDIIRVPRQDVLGLPPFTVQQPRFFRGVVPIGELGDFLVLDSTTLMESPELQTLSTLNMADDKTGERVAEQDDWAGSSAGASGTGALFLTYSVAGDLASPLEQILEILPYPQEHTSLGDPQGAVLGLLTHRESVVPLVCLATLMGACDRPDPTSSCVLLVSTGTGTIGLVVRSLGAIERSVWEERVEDASGARLDLDPLARALADRRTLRTAPVGSVGSERMLPRLDLVAIAAGLVANGSC